MAMATSYLGGLDMRRSKELDLRMAMANNAAVTYPIPCDDVQVLSPDGAWWPYAHEPSPRRRRG